MKLSTQILFEQAYGKYAIGAYNVFTAEQVHAVFSGAQKSGSPVIVALTPAARKYAQPAMLDAMVKAAETIYPDVVYAVHLDHGDEEHCKSAISSGSYNSVMIDASYQPFDDNVTTTAAIVQQAHDSNIAVEAELGVLAGVEDDITIDEQKSRFTDPDQALEFVQRTRCDSLAIAVGTSHGAYKFSGDAGLQLQILADIQAKLPEVPLVLHGASAVPLQEIKRINAAGGTLKESARGTDEKELLEAIKLGVCKINIATDARLMWARIHREFFRDEPDKFDPIVPGKQYIDELAEFVVQKNQLLGAAGQAAKF